MHISISTPDHKKKLCSYLTRTLLASFIFSFHGLVVVWRVVALFRNEAYYFLFLPASLITIEGIVSIFLDTKVPKQLFANVLLYLCTVIPSVWLLQLHCAERKELCNATDTVLDNNNGTLFFSSYHSIDWPFENPVDDRSWVITLTQSLVVILIIVRWILPKRYLTRDEISQLLLAWLAMGADIVDVFDHMQYDLVFLDRRNVVVVLFCWTLSLTPFVFVIATNRRLHKRSADMTPIIKKWSKMTLQDKRKRFVQSLLKEPEFWGILVTIFLQDGPFLAMRLYLNLALGLRVHSMIFFTCKNTLIILLTIYRLYVVSAKIHQEQKNYHNAMQMMSFARKTIADLADHLEPLPELAQLMLKEIENRPPVEFDLESDNDPPPAPPNPPPPPTPPRHRPPPPPPTTQ